ncbi:MAG: 50S ribosomal protein L3 [Candidatus Paceibacterota bacterium]
MKFLLGKKQYMTQIFDDEGNVQPVTVIKAGPLTVLGKREEERDGYNALILGYEPIKKEKVARAQQKQYDGTYRHIREVKDGDDMEIGATVDVSVFEEGEKVAVSGTTKGKGFQGVVKRYNFAGGPASHGQKHSHREGGSIGATGPQEVFKGTRMPGRMGGERKTISNLTIVRTDSENGLLFVRGAVPGRKGTLVEIRG